ncbi:class GN sortase [Allohahella sp. A8]|uniref:class GN sortase n=1 Tax=Allohahella sp. A8 TaxID=3141461 RepID=UPI000C09ABA8|nr:class GN sortase [Hahellaceae bacterium]|tara:strand:- start:55983 stop:56660 length:678 start_codon:yes stop_codon:yes gene_type:complete
MSFNAGHWARRGLLGLVLCGSLWALGSALWIDVKAIVAQALLEQAWASTMSSQRYADPGQNMLQVKPWPWADVWPVGRLQFPNGSTYVVLNGTSGQALAFGPGQVENSAAPGAGRTILAGHRDTHFAELKDVRERDVFTLQDSRGVLRRYTVRSIRIVDSRAEKLHLGGAAAELQLVSCYPFDELTAGGPLRYVVTAEMTEQVSGSNDIESTEQHVISAHTADRG